MAKIETEHDGKGPSFGLMAPGYFWIDDVSLERVCNDVPLTEQPVLGKEESPIAAARARWGRRRPMSGVRLPQPACLAALLRLRQSVGGRPRSPAAARRSSGWSPSRAVAF